MCSFVINSTSFKINFKEFCNFDKMHIFSNKFTHAPMDVKYT